MTSPKSDGPEEAPLQQLFQEIILEHYRRPRNKGALPDRTHEVTLNNPLCGDVVNLALRVEDGRIAEARFEGRGCSISQASASMLTERLQDRPLDEALELAEAFTGMLHGDEEAAGNPALGDLRALAGVRRFPVRVKCALLPFDCLENLLQEAGAGADPGPEV